MVSKRSYFAFGIRDLSLTLAMNPTSCQSATRDAIGFGVFFSVFEGGRIVARQARAKMDQALVSMGLSLGDEDDVGRRWPGRLVYVCLVHTTWFNSRLQLKTDLAL
jgi:hypothetical protein